LQKDKKNLISSDPKRIKDLFIDAFNKASENSAFETPDNSRSVITIKLLDGSNKYFSFDIAILREENNGNFYKLVYDKPTNRYLWNELKDMKNYQERFKAVKAAKKFSEFKERYGQKKNDNLSKKRNISSFSVFLETLNEIIPK
jgi:hypothetical protein